MDEVIWSGRALDDLKQIHAFIALDSSFQADKVVKEITDKTNHLVQFPSMGRFVPELAGSGVRELIAYSYRILYYAEKERVNILAIVHGKQDMDSSFFKK